MDRIDRHIVTTPTEVKRNHPRAPIRKEPLPPEEISTIFATLPSDLCGLSDRAFLLVGHAGNLRRSEIATLDMSNDDTPYSRGWLQILDAGVVLTARGRDRLQSKYQNLHRPIPNV